MIKAVLGEGRKGKLGREFERGLHCRYSFFFGSPSEHLAVRLSPFPRLTHPSNNPCTGLMYLFSFLCLPSRPHIAYAIPVPIIPYPPPLTFLLIPISKHLTPPRCRPYTASMMTAIATAIAMTMTKGAHSTSRVILRTVSEIQASQRTNHALQPPADSSRPLLTAPHKKLSPSAVLGAGKAG